MRQLDPTAVVELLESTPGRIHTATLGLSENDIAWKPSEDSWSINEVLAHLRACTDVWVGSIAKILSEDKPAFRYSRPSDTFLRVPGSEKPTIQVQTSRRRFSHSGSSERAF